MRKKPIILGSLGAIALAAGAYGATQLSEVLPVAEKHLRDILEHADLKPREIERASA